MNSSLGARQRSHRRALAFVAVLLATAGCDHATKRIASDVLAAAPPLSLAAGLLRFELATNAGGLLSVGAGLPAELRRFLFLAVVPLGLLAAGLAVLRSTSLSGASLGGLSLLLGGGLANWLDRLAHGGLVTDFVSLGLGPLRTGIFNVADLAVMLGAAVLLVASGTEGPGRVRARGSARESGEAPPH